MRSVSQSLQQLPWLVVISAALLMVAGLAGIARGDELNPGRVLQTRQIVWILIALPAMAAAAWIPYRIWKPWSYPLFGATLLLLGVVYFFPAKNGAHRWIPLGVADLQPSELAKITYIMALSHYLMYRRNYRRLTGLIVPFLLTLVPVLLILREPDLGTSLLFFPVLYGMLFAAGAKARHLIAVSLLGVMVLPVLWTQMSAEQKSRITALFNQQDGGPTPRGDGYHLHQSKQVLALGGMWGSDVTGMPIDDPLAYHLPAAQTDFIFCMIGERWGLPGTIGVLLVYLLLFGRGLMIAAATQEPFGRLMAVGIVMLFAAQLTINTGMTVGLMPITGLTLPLVSYGGSSLLTMCIAVGLLLNVGLRPGYEITGEPFRFRDGE
ncbi:MAG: rod shape-determining protein RodA [Planctomycetaceae bacterium]|nr:rod shape-determining protein RodA [Planctomycetaceae bacterium]